MREFSISFSYEWQPILLDENKEYLFPLTITPFMRMKYKEPAVYRWNIYDQVPGDRKTVYIGEAQELCPQRLYGYLNPGPSQQTNKRIKALFEDYLRNGLKVGLEFCKLGDGIFGQSKVGKELLSDDNLRLMVEKMMISEHKTSGFVVLNK